MEQLYLEGIQTFIFGAEIRELHDNTLYHFPGYDASIKVCEEFLVELEGLFSSCMVVSR